MDNRTSVFGSRKNRNSIIQSAGDALGLRMGKRKRLSRQAPLDDLILEISASKNADYPASTTIANSEDELAERERLRDAAAQAVGLAHGAEDSASLKSHPRSVGPAPIFSTLPRYPAVLSSFQSLIQTSSHLLKFYPSPTPFLILSRSRQWKTRYLVLTSIQPHGERGGTESYLHLFKTGASDEKELERLSIQQDSVVYIADEEVGGGRQYIVKVGGKQVNGMTNAKKETAPPVVWLLQMPDATHMQRWIQFIKSSVFMQRAERAGLSRYNHSYNRAPDIRGDLDVMLSMGHQGLLSTNSTSRSVETSQKRDDHGFDGPIKQGSGSGAHLGPVSALKGLFNGRPISRQLSVSGSSISAGTSSANPVPQSSPTPNPPDSETASSEGTSKLRDSSLFQMFRPSGNGQPQSPHLRSPMPPPISPTTSLPISDDATNSPVSTSTARFPASLSSRHLHHSSSFSVDWDAIDGTSLVAVNSQRIKTGNSTALAPPPRRRPLTASGYSNRQSSPPKDPLTEKKTSSYTNLEQGEEFDGIHDSKSVLTEGMNLDDTTTEGDTSHFRSISDAPPINLSPITPITNQSYGQEDDESQQSVPESSPVHPGAQPVLSSSSSFGATTNTHDYTVGGMLTKPSPSSLHSGSREDLATEEEHRDLEGEMEFADSGRLSTSTRRRTRLGVLPRQLSPPPGPLPAVPLLNSPQFVGHSSSVDHSGSERPGSSSSIPSTVPSLHAGMSNRLAKRLSTMSSASAQSVRSNDSSAASTNNSKIVGGSPFGVTRSSLSSGSTTARTTSFPPQRPPPTFAPPLPPALPDEFGNVLEQTRHSLSNRFSGSGIPQTSRSEFINRVTRYSVGPPPAPPPSIALPPRPDDPFSLSPPHTQTLFTIPASPNINGGARLPASSPPPSQPLPPTPIIGDSERPVSPSLSTSSAHSSRSTPAASFGRMSSLKQRFRIMSNPTPSRRHSQQIPPPQPPPTGPPPAIPGETSSSPFGYLSGGVHLRRSTDTSDYPAVPNHSPPLTPLGEAITSRIEPNPMANTTSLVSPIPLSAISAFTSITTRSPPPPEVTPLSPPPRRNSRASRDLTPQDKERWKSIVVSLEEQGNLSSYDSVPAKHSAINLPSLQEH